MMKLMIKQLGILALVLFAAVSCEVGGLEPEQPEGPVSKIQVSMGASILSTKSNVIDNNGNRTLTFFEGDRLYVRGLITGTSPQKIIAGYLSIDGEYDGTSVTFKGDLDIYVEEGGTYVPGTHDFGNEPLEQCSDILGILVHAGTGGFTVDASSKVGSYTDAVAYYVNDLMTQCLPVYGYYDNGSQKIAMSVGDTKDSCTPIFNVRLTGLTANAEYTLVYQNGDNIASIDVTKTLGTIRADGTGYVTFACYVSGATTAEKYHGFLLTNTADANDVKIVSLGTKVLASKVYNVTRQPIQPINLANVASDYTAQSYDYLYGTLANNVKISIAEGAMVWLGGVSINADGAWTDTEHAGITCLGNATINLSGTNTVTGFKKYYPGIQAAHNDTGSGDEYTLTIQGNGSLTASCNSINNNGNAAGIGGAYEIPCGNIVIAGGSITANGSGDSAGIGGGSGGNCGSITISGGTVIAKCASANTQGPGIGSGNNATCGDITISGGDVTAMASSQQAAGIGTGGNNSNCGKITISGGTVVATGSNYGPGIGPGYQGCNCNGGITIGAGITSITAIRGLYTRDAEMPDVQDAPCIGSVNNGSSYCTSVTFGSLEMCHGNSWDTWPESGKDYGGLHIVISKTNKDNDTWTLTPVTP